MKFDNIEVIIDHNDYSSQAKIEEALNDIYSYGVRVKSSQHKEIYADCSVDKKQQYIVNVYPKVGSILYMKNFERLPSERYKVFVNMDGGTIVDDTNFMNTIIKISSFSQAARR